MQEFVVFLQQHWMLSIALCVVLILLVIMEFAKAKQGTNQLTPQSTINFINHKNAIVVDIRSQDAFANGHIVSSVSLPLSELEEKYKKLEKYRDQPLIIACATGNDSSRAISSLQKKGFQVQLLKGGIRAWQLAGLPLVKD